MSESRTRALVFGVLAMGTVAASFPAWTGTWIYDDWAMRWSEEMDDVSDLLDVFGRTSQAYLKGDLSGGATYRPLSMASLIAVHMLAPEPLPHHLLSVALHLVVVGLLFSLAANRLGLRWAMGLAGLLALHPLCVEAYGWINGRSDVLAGVGVMLVAFALFSERRAHARTLLAVIGAALAVFAKETGMIALLGVLLAACMPDGEADRSPPRRAETWGPVLGALTVVLLCLGVRSRLPGASSSSDFLLTEAPEAWTTFSRLFVVAAKSMVVATPRTMANLAHELAQPIDGVGVLLLLAASAVATMLVIKRQWRALVLLAFAFACLVPCIVVRHKFWHGLDRYLYLPLLLICLAAITRSPSGSAKTLIARPLVYGLQGAIALCLMSTTWMTSMSYASQPAFIASMIELRPNDPTGYLVGIEWLTNVDQTIQAEALSKQVPRDDMAPALALRFVTLLGKLGHRDEAIAVVNDVERRHPNDLNVLANVTGVRIQEGKLDAAIATARRLEGIPSFCASARDAIAPVLTRDGSAAHKDKARAFLANYRCPP